MLAGQEQSKGSKNRLTLPVLYSTEAAFFLLSVTSAPATVAVTVSGGVCRKPGPSVSVFFLPVPVGRALFAMLSPGRTIVADAAMVVFVESCL
jgi:hypothetical protein